MLKSLTLSLALALGFAGVSKAGHGGGGCDTCGLASPQGVVASPQASAQVETCGTCAPAKKKCCLADLFKHKPKMYTYEWVLKKKRVHHAKAAESCGTPAAYPTSYASPQGYSSPQAYSAPQSYAAPQAYGAPQASAYPTSATVPAPSAPASTGDEVPPAPPVPSGTQSSLLFLAPAGN